MTMFFFGHPLFSGRTHLARVALAVEQDEASYPEDILIFCANGVMFRPEPLAPLIEQARRRWGIRRGKRRHILRDGEGNQMKQQLKVERFEL